ncbi:MAG: helix-turn-helix domain-containing protein [Chloroflexota bacterium]|nr:helix-turn-helix domain-containing protein [Chloroflexota bacterium]
MDTIWGEEIVVDERTVDVHVSWLRGKLAVAGVGAAVISTVYGAGYRFIVPAKPPTGHG